MFRPLARLFPQLYAAKPAIRATPEWTIGTGTADENPEIRFRRELYERLRSPITVRWLDRSRIRIFPNNELSRVVYLTGLYEPNEFLWLDRFLARGMTVIDAGANQGLYTIFAARRVGPEGDGVLRHYGFGLIPIVTRELEGEDLVSSHPGFGKTRMKRICKLPELNARARALPEAS